MDPSRHYPLHLPFPDAFYLRSFAFILPTLPPGTPHPRTLPGLQRVWDAAPVISGIVSSMVRVINFVFNFSVSI
jgi:hypothetical protein